jgi:hypothetical protein
MAIRLKRRTKPANAILEQLARLNLVVTQSKRDARSNPTRSAFRESVYRAFARPVRLRPLMDGSSPGQAAAAHGHLSTQLERLNAVTAAILTTYGDLLAVEVPMRSTAGSDVVAAIDGVRYGADVARFVSAVHALQHFIEEQRLVAALSGGQTDGVVGGGSGAGGVEDEDMEAGTRSGRGAAGAAGAAGGGASTVAGSRRAGGRVG